MTRWPATGRCIRARSNGSAGHGADAFAPAPATALASAPASACERQDQSPAEGVPLPSKEVARDRVPLLASMPQRGAKNLPNLALASAPASACERLLNSAGFLTLPAHLAALVEQLEMQK